MSHDKKEIPASLKSYFDTVAASHDYPDLNQHKLELWCRNLVLVVDEPNIIAWK